MRGLTESSNPFCITQFTATHKSQFFKEILHPTISLYHLAKVIKSIET